MRLLRKIVPLISLVLLLGFTMASLEDTFFCSDEAATTHSDADCCAQCLSLHTMALAREVGIENIVVNFQIIFSESSSQLDPSPFRIDRPPII